MSGSVKFFILIGCFLLLAAVILRYAGLYSPAILVIKPSSLLILANISFVLAVLAKKS
ncbi:MAG: hypothetical protein PHF11_01035 [Candidatus Omnitrophica bacterium]|nr:hypothetical protein [Candidatus Omnitrophota bacterium]